MTMARAMAAGVAAAAMMTAGPAQAFERAPIKRIEVFERPEYDRKLERAAVRIVAGKIGEIRGAIDEAVLIPLIESLRNDPPRFVIVADGG